MQAFDLFLYALAIITVLLLRAETNPATTPATEAQPQPITEAMPEPEPLATVAATITEPVVSVTIPTEATPATEAPADLATLKTPQLRKLCSQRGITWRNALGVNRHLPKAAMVEALLAS